MSKEKQRPQKKSVEHTEEPKSAHATPIVEKYVEKRKHKAERQVEKEQHED